MKFEFTWEDSTVWAEVNLIKTVLVNLIDNACKASEPGSRVSIRGKKLKMATGSRLKMRALAFPSRSSTRLPRHFIWWTNPAPGVRTALDWDLRSARKS